ncbi:hypothetical protein [Burkholderia sp. BE12]|uniref:hypothetical protein n=1 Tax=Burkholderia sp. BE12 TaxID=2082394 RepID=UPI001319F76B|nr:hypothetical protein [Burkholderia sp. BE12]
MHPKAATLALAGYTLVLYMLPGDHPSSTVRVVRRGLSEFGETISHCTLDNPRRRWGFDHAGAGPDEYVDVPWDRIPYDTWDTLPDWMIARALQGE